MTKRELLTYLADTGCVDAYQVAADLGTSYPVAAMALLRLVRQALVSRALDAHAGLYRYQLSERGYQRLAYFQELDDAGLPRPTTFDLRSTRRSLMKRKKLHSGIYHCPACFIEFDLAGEESLQCDQCHGPLAKGSLDEVWDDDDDDEE